MGRHHEREVKLAVPPGFDLPPLEGVGEGLVCTRAADLRLEATYYDTPDLRLARSGATLRHRSPDGWTLKVPQPDSDGPVLSRRELHVNGADDGVPPELARLATAWVRTSTLAPVANLRTLRRTSQLVDGEGTVVLEVVDDEVEVGDGLLPDLRFRELEVELAPGAPDGLLSEVLARLGSAGACPADPNPKVFRALGPDADSAPELAGDRVEDCVSAGEVLAAGLRASVRRLLAADLGVRLGEDPEEVHRARVAARRLRSHLRTWAPLIDAQWAAEVGGELKRLGRALGRVRDVDVMLGRLRRAAGDLDPGDAAAAGRILDRLEREEAAARVELAGVLDDDRYPRLLDRLVDALADPVSDATAGPRRWLTAGAAGAPAEVLPPLVRRRWRKLRDAARSLDPSPSADQLHRVRILAKRCRYGAEVAADAAGPPAEKMAEALARLQDVLGEHHDAVVAETWLRESLPTLSTEEAMVAGQLVAAQREAAEASLGAWPKAWRKVDRRKRRAWLKT